MPQTEPVVNDDPAPDAEGPHQVETCMVRLAEGRPGFVMDLADPEGHTLSVEFPGWIVHQLMRILPRVDAALQPPSGADDPDQAAALPAYPVSGWQVLGDGGAQDLSLHLRDDREVEAAFRFNLEQAVALQLALTREIERVADAPPPAA